MSHGFIRKTLGVVFADGSCNQFNKCAGGWGTVACLNGEVIEIGGSETNTTNNRMEMTAVIQGLHLIEGNPQHVVILSDSQYVVMGINNYMETWLKRNWVTAGGDPVKNQDLWIQLLEVRERLSSKCHVSFQWCRGHAGINGNHIADKIAEAYCAGREPDLYLGTYERYKVDLHDIRHKDDRKQQETRDRANARNQANKAGLIVSSRNPLDMIEAEAQAMIDRQMGRLKTISTI